MIISSRRWLKRSAVRSSAPSARYTTTIAEVAGTGEIVEMVEIGEVGEIVDGGEVAIKTTGSRAACRRSMTGNMGTNPAISQSDMASKNRAHVTSFANTEKKIQRQWEKRRRAAKKKESELS